jgi:elongation factor Ts
MSDVSASTIKELREMTGAGMMDCKKALVEAKGSMEEAVDWLRKKGLAAAAKKSGRVAAEGLVAVATAGSEGAIIELNAETDFVARNEQFQALAKTICALALAQPAGKGGDVDILKHANDPESGSTVEALISQNVATIGENMSLRRCAKLSVSKGVIASYIHSAVAPGLGKIGVLVALESEGDKAQLEALGKQIAMHIAAAKPEALTTADVDPAKLARERTVLKEQAIASGKPAEIAEKMVEGRIRKYYEEVVLHEQIYVMDNKTKISDVVAEAGKAMGKPVKLAGFVHFKLGEGIEKQESDFAAEVAAAAGAA